MAKTLDLTELEFGSKIIFAGQTFKVDSFANMAGKDIFSITIHGIEANEPMGVETKISVDIKEPIKKYPHKAYVNGRLVDPGEGYRLLELGETILEGDEFHEFGQKWRKTICGGGEFFVEKPDNCYRRKL